MSDLPKPDYVPDGVEETDLTFQKLLVAAYLDKFNTGIASDDVWGMVVRDVGEKASNPAEAARELLKFAELLAGILEAVFPDPQGALSSLRSFSGNVDD